MNEQDDLIGDMIAEVARSHGVAISRDDPIVAVVLLNQIVLRRYLEETVAPATDAIREATNEAARQIEQFAEAQATWLEQVSLKDREQFAEAQATWLEQVSLKDRGSFLKEQKTLHDAWKAEMQALVEGQNAALQQVVVQTAVLLRNQGPAAGPALASPPAPLQAQASAPPRIGTPWAWMWAGMLLRTGATVVPALAAAVWLPLAA